jgi:hypothetical protein
MKALSIDYSTSELIKRAKIKMRVTCNINYNIRKSGTLSTITEFKSFKKLLRSKLKDSSTSKSEKIELKDKLLFIEYQISWLEICLGGRLICDLKPKSEYFYIPQAIFYE